MLPAGGFDLRDVLVRGHQGARDADDPAAFRHLLVIFAPVERGHQLAVAQVARGAEHHEVEHRDGDDLGSHRLSRNLSTAARVGNAGIAPRSQGGESPHGIGEAADPVELVRLGHGIGLGQETGDQAGHEAVPGTGGVDRRHLVGGHVVLRGRGEPGRAGTAAAQRDQAQAVVPELADGGRVAAAGHELELVVAQLDHLRLGHAGADPRPRRVGVGPERQAEVDVVGHEMAGGTGLVGGEQAAGARILAGEADRIEVQHLGGGDGRGVHRVGGEHHVRAGVAVEHELPLAVGAQGHERQCCPRLGREPQGADIDPGLGQGGGQEVAERVVAHHADEGAGHAQPGETHRDVGGRTAGGLHEGRRVGETRAGRRRDEVDQKIAHAHHLSHRPLLSSAFHRPAEAAPPGSPGRRRSGSARCGPALVVGDIVAGDQFRRQQDHRSRPASRRS